MGMIGAGIDARWEILAAQRSGGSIAHAFWDRAIRVLALEDCALVRP